MGHPTRRDIVVGAAAATLLGGAAAAQPETPPAASGPGPTPAPGPTPPAAPGPKPAGAGARSPTAAAAARTTTARGTVSEVVARGLALAKGPPIANVIISNGREITRSDGDGRWSLPIAPGQTLSLVKPTGFRVPVDAATKLPLFSYVYDPDGTPSELGFRYGGMPPTGPLPATLDFQLTRVAEPSAFDVILFTDPQPESPAELDFVRDTAVSGLIGSKAAFGITCGDLMFDDLSMYDRFNRIVGRIGLTWWSVGGNHDLDYEAPDAARARDTWKRHFGATYYAHEFGNTLFVMLDNVEYNGAGSGKPGRPGTYRGFIAPDQLAFVKALLAATPTDRLVVFVMHIPLRTYLDPVDPAMNTANAADLLALIGDRPSVSFAGHTHTCEHHYFGPADGVTGKAPHHHVVLAAVSGSWWSGPRDHRGIASADGTDGTPNGFHILSVDGAGYTTRFVPASEPAGSQMRISLESGFHQGDRETLGETTMARVLRSPISADQAAATRLVVNVFAGGPRTKVGYTIDGFAPAMMTSVSRADPFIVQVYGRHPETIKPWVKPQASSHLWEAPLPRGIKPGTYTLQVFATDDYGRRLTQGIALEVV